jgi:ribosomal protein S18 acetylase RimI-like enzyme
MNIITLNNKNDMEHVRALFLEYAESLPFKLDFQNFEQELDDLPGKYKEPSGCIMVAFIDEEAVGCIAIREIENNICEMKRLYVKSKYRGVGMGKKLVDESIKKAKEKGYKYMKLDTLASMKGAVSLYRSKGFIDIESYIYNPFEDALFMQLKL